MHDEDELLSAELKARLQNARSELLQRMAQRGCHAADGWRIHEELASSPTGTMYVLRAVHRVHPGHPDLFATVPVPR